MDVISEKKSIQCEESELKSEIWEVLKSVYDPEVGLDIVNLGLIYDVRLVKTANLAGFTVEIALTLTSPTCPLGGFIIDSIRSTVAAMSAKVSDVQVQLVWDPPWSRDRISEVGKMELGLI